MIIKYNFTQDFHPLLFLEFYQFPKPAVDNLHYWRTKMDARKWHHSQWRSQPCSDARAQLFL